MSGHGRRSGGPAGDGGPAVTACWAARARARRSGWAVAGIGGRTVMSAVRPRVLAIRQSEAASGSSATKAAGSVGV
ncbi:hypothetical protein [Streptomyces solicathayae]|uniref:Uncharacterized protein n=1 Tax=Streptomyces solicathayae TaxID=3081768 RepID=A0ABZ0LMK1_9ACTN|nr:hypothetical protein [Streptomyces sp. HUAS YS2]WOX20712.1 hypothetical protein R2D22_04610 [Streptomyces sp. HUAS YS2]